METSSPCHCVGGSKEMDVVQEIQHSLHVVLRQKSRKMHPYPIKLL